MRVREAFRDQFGQAFEDDVTEELAAQPSRRNVSKSAQMLEYFYDNNVYGLCVLNTLPKDEWVQWASMPSFNSLCANYFTLVKMAYASNYKLLPVVERFYYNRIINANGVDLGHRKIERLLEFQGYSEKRINYFRFAFIAVFDQLLGKYLFNYIYIYLY